MYGVIAEDLIFVFGRTHYSAPFVIAAKATMAPERYRDLITAIVHGSTVRGRATSVVILSRFTMSAEMWRSSLRTEFDRVYTELRIDIRPLFFKHNYVPVVDENWRSYFVVWPEFGAVRRIVHHVDHPPTLQQLRDLRPFSQGRRLRL